MHRSQAYTSSFDKENVTNTLGEYLVARRNSSISPKPRKYAHVTFFFNGGREEPPFNGEDRILVPSPKVATYDLKARNERLRSKGQTCRPSNRRSMTLSLSTTPTATWWATQASIPPSRKAVECVKDTVEAAKEADYEVIIIADHGNADNAINPDGTPNTAHSLESRAPAST